MKKLIVFAVAALAIVGGTATGAEARESTVKCTYQSHLGVNLTIEGWDATWSLCRQLRGMIAPAYPVRPRGVVRCIYSLVAKDVSIIVRGGNAARYMCRQFARRLDSTWVRWQ
jgi:hypothetical protein